MARAMASRWDLKNVPWLGPKQRYRSRAPSIPPRLGIETWSNETNNDNSTKYRMSLSAAFESSIGVAKYELGKCKCNASG